MDELAERGTELTVWDTSPEDAYMGKYNVLSQNMQKGFPALAKLLYSGPVWMHNYAWRMPENEVNDDEPSGYFFHTFV